MIKQQYFLRKCKRLIVRLKYAYCESGIQYIWLIASISKLYLYQ